MQIISYVGGCDGIVAHELTGVWLGSGSDGAEVPPIYIDRVGAKVGLEDTYSRNSKGSLNLVLQQVKMYSTLSSPVSRCLLGSAGLLHA